MSYPDFASWTVDKNGLPNIELIMIVTFQVYLHCSLVQMEDSYLYFHSASAIWQASISTTSVGNASFFFCPTPIRRSVFHGLQDLRKIEAVRGDSINGICLLHGCEYP